MSKVDAVPIDVTAKKYSDQLDITLGTTNTMKIKKDEVVTISVPVNVTAKGDPAEGYAVGRVTSTPNLIKVSGPENLLSSAKEIRATVSVDGISHDVTATDKPVLYDEEGKKVIPGSLQRIIILFLLIMNQNRLRLQHRMICWKVWIPLH